MQGVIANYRCARHHQKGNQMVVQVEGYSSKDDAVKLVGKSVVWKSPAGKELKGSVSSTHGNKGAVRVLFETGMPGQAIGQKVVVQ